MKKMEKSLNLMECGEAATDSTSKGKPDIEAVDTTSRLNTLSFRSDDETNYL